MDQHYCLNCGAPAEKRYCPECGQKTDTHRITPKHFIMHDLVHGVFHLDRGILFTLKETFTRPGHAARDYISGKRKNYYNVFYLLLLVLGIYMIINGYDALVAQTDKEFEDTKLPANLVSFLKFVVLYAKYLILLIVPILALSAFIVFQRLNYNYAEHLIISGYMALGGIILMLAGVLIGKISDMANVIVTLLGPPLFMVWGYWQVTKQKYSFMGYLLRLIPFFILCLMWFIIILGILASIFLT